MVNCKTCRCFGREVPGFMKGYHTCEKFGMYMKAEDFCSRWEDRQYWDKIKEIEDREKELEEDE